MDEIRDAFLKKGYILVIIGGGITVDVQVNDTHVHHRLKKIYRLKEQKKMLKKLEENKYKIPQVSRQED